MSLFGNIFSNQGQLYRDGELVEYFSASIEQWIPATVLRYNAEANIYMLDCKPDVPAERIRHMPVNPEPVAVCHTPKTIVPPTIPMGAPNVQSNLKFHINAKVEYYSASIQQWIPARVTGYDSTDKTYYLDVKPQVPEDRMRWPENPESQEDLGAAAVGQRINRNSAEDNNDRTLTPDLTKNAVKFNGRTPRTAAGAGSATGPHNPPATICPPQARVSFNDQVSRSESSYQSQDSTKRLANEQKQWAKEREDLNKQLCEMDALNELQKHKLSIAERERDRCVIIESELAETKKELEVVKSRSKKSIEEMSINSASEVNDLKQELEAMRKELKEVKSFKMTADYEVNEWKSKYEEASKKVSQNNDKAAVATQKEEALKDKVRSTLSKLEDEKISHQETLDAMDLLKIQVAQKDKEIEALNFGLEDYKRNTNPVMSQLTNMFERSGRIVTAS